MHACVCMHAFMLVCMHEAQLSAISDQLSTISYHMSTISYQLSTLNSQLSTINYFKWAPWWGSSAGQMNNVGVLSSHLCRSRSVCAARAICIVRHYPHSAYSYYLVAFGQSRHRAPACGRADGRGGGWLRVLACVCVSMVRGTPGTRFKHRFRECFFGHFLWFSLYILHFCSKVGASSV